MPSEIAKIGITLGGLAVSGLVGFTVSNIRDLMTESAELKTAMVYTQGEIKAQEIQIQEIKDKMFELHPMRASSLFSGLESPLILEDE